MNPKELFALRLKQARILNKISMDQLVLKMNSIVSKQAISKYEAAQMMPSSSTMIALATALGVETDYFTRPISFDVDHFDVSFRKKSSTSMKDVKALKVQIQDQVERYLEVEEILGKSFESIQRSQGEEISTAEQMRELACQLRKDWNLGTDAIGNVQAMLESKGIKVISTDAPEDFDGVSGVVNDKHLIVVLNNSKNHIERRRFTSMHELGHLLCNHRFSSELTSREKEKLCNSFASEMLLPTDTLKETLLPGEKLSLSELEQLQIVYGISIDAIMHRLHEIGIVSDKKYRSYNIQKNRDKALKNFVEKTRYKEELTTRFETMVYAATAKNLISTSKAASLLHSSVGMVRKHLNVV